MGVSLPGGGSSSRTSRRARTRSEPMAEINVTPFVDVMLVLLVIFMVTAPLLTSGVPLDLLKTKSQQLSSDKEPFTVSVNNNGEIFLQDTKITLQDIGVKLKAIKKGGPDETIFVRGDTKIDYGLVIKVMARINAAGWSSL